MSNTQADDLLSVARDFLADAIDYDTAILKLKLKGFPVDQCVRSLNLALGVLTEN
jgi:hypothetical protein